MADFNENEIPEFLKDLMDGHNRSGNKGSRPVKSEITVLNMKNKKNWGTLDIIPIDGEEKGASAIKQLNRVGHVEKWIQYKDKNGAEQTFCKKMFFFMDPKYYGELNDDQLRQLDRIKSKFNDVYNNKPGNVQMHQITLIQGYIVNHTEYKTDKVLHEGIPALCIFESKNFEKSFQEANTDMASNLESYSWLYKMCDRTPLKKRFYEIKFYLDKDKGAGFQTKVTVGKFDEDTMKKFNHTSEGYDLSKKGDDFFTKFKNPIKTYLELPQDKPIFNADYINEIEAILNKIIKGESTTEVNTETQGEPTKPNSNENFTDSKSNEAPAEEKQEEYVPQDENEPVPTKINVPEAPAEPAETKKDDDDLPF